MILDLEPQVEYDVRVLGGTKAGWPTLEDEDWPWVTGLTSSQHIAGGKNSQTNHIYHWQIAPVTTNLSIF